MGAEPPTARVAPPLPVAKARPDRAPSIAWDRGPSRARRSSAGPKKVTRGATTRASVAPFSSPRACLPPRRRGTRGRALFRFTRRREEGGAWGKRGVSRRDRRGKRDAEGKVPLPLAGGVRGRRGATKACHPRHCEEPLPLSSMRGAQRRGEIALPRRWQEDSLAERYQQRIRKGGGLAESVGR